VAGLSLAVGVILFLGSEFIAGTVFSKPHLQFYFILASFFIIFQSISNLNTQAVRGLRLVRVFAFMQILPSFSNLLLMILLTVLFFHPHNPVYILLASFTITALAGAVIMDRKFKSKTRPNDTVCPVPIKDILAISFPMFLTATITFVIGQTGVILLGMYRPETDVGYYAIAVKLSTLTAFVLQAVLSMAGPRFSELYHSNQIDELFYVAHRSAKLIFWATSPILLVLILFGKPIITILYGVDFSVAYWAMVLLTLGQFVNSISGATGLFMNMTGHQNAFKNIVLIAALMNLGLNILLTPLYGLYGAAIAGMLSLMIWNIAALCYIKRKFGRTTGYIPFLTKPEANK
jgi:O-antigen/teichoic acid export membrane protein